MLPPALRALVAVTAVAVGGCAGSQEVARPAPSTTVPPNTAPSTTATTLPPTTLPPTTLPPTTLPPDDGTLRPGESGPEVLELQQRLDALGFWLGEPDGTYGHLTAQAVMAFQKANGLGRDGLAGPATLAALAGATRPAARTPEVDGLEIDLERQLLLVVTGGEVRWALNTSTGRRGWSTPDGTYRIGREIDGWRRAPLGDLYRPKYFVGGIAVHGSTSIPAYPASHGCARVSLPAMDLLWSSGVASPGTEVRVYH